MNCVSDTDPLRSQPAVAGMQVFVYVRFAAEFASVIPSNDQTSGKNATETFPVMFRRRIASPIPPLDVYKSN